MAIAGAADLQLAEADRDLKAMLDSLAAAQSRLKVLLSQH